MVLILMHFIEKSKNPIPGFIVAGLSILLVKLQANASSLSMRTSRSSRYSSFLNSVLILFTISRFLRRNMSTKTRVFLAVELEQKWISGSFIPKMKIRKSWSSANEKRRKTESFGLFSRRKVCPTKRGETIDWQATGAGREKTRSIIWSFKILASKMRENTSARLFMTGRMRRMNICWKRRWQFRASMRLEAWTCRNIWELIRNIVMRTPSCALSSAQVKGGKIIEKSGKWLGWGWTYLAAPPPKFNFCGQHLIGGNTNLMGS